MKALSIIILLFALSATTAFGQDTRPEPLLTDKGHQILPEAGDWSIGFNAIPLIDFALNAVNIMNNTGQTAENPGYVEGFDQIITGKYFTSPRFAYRFRFGLTYDADNFSNFFDDPLDDTDNPGQLETVFRERTTELFASAGVEYRRGEGRVQGFYGSEGILSYGSAIDKFEYGLAWTSEAEDAGLVFDGQSRVISDRDGRSFGLGARGFVGVEFFFASKMSFALEYGLGIIYTRQGRGEVVTELYENGSTSTVETAGNNTQSSFSTGIDNANAALSLLIHF